MKSKVLVCGGCGYIGSHTVRALMKSSAYEVVILDNMSTGHMQSVPKGVTVESADIRDKKSIAAVFEKHKIDAVMHFCASISVGESVVDPLGYYENNVTGTINLIEQLVKNKVKYFIFSSTAALFGYPERIPIEEDDLKIPANPYGDTKLVVETMLKWCDDAYGLKYTCLRYFNACGADPEGSIGEDHRPETHLIPLILQVPLGKREKVYIFGEDYDTPDGSCIRDYVHVNDIASAHILALERMMKENKSDRFNLGCGKGYSVKEIIEAARRVTKHPIPCEIKERRPGDPAVLVASSKKAETVLNWKRQYETIDDIVATAWDFHRKNADGYKF